MSEEWGKLNQAYWDAWKKLAAAATPASAAPEPSKTTSDASAQNPWADVIEQWWALAKGGPAEDAASTEFASGFGIFNQMVEQSRQMFGFAEMLKDAFDDRSDASPLERFASSLRDAIGSFRMANRAAEFAVPFMQWPLAPPVSGSTNPFEAFAQGSAPGGRFRLKDDWDPAAFTQVFSAYHKALNEVAEQQFRALENAVGELPSLGLPEGGEASAEAMRSFYQRWIDACDKALGELSESETYGEKFGALVNNYLRLQQMLWSPEDEGEDERAADRARMEEIENAVAAVEASLSKLRHDLGELPLGNLLAHVEVLTDEINELREELDAVKSTAEAPGQTASSESPAPAPKQKSPRRKTRVKPAKDAATASVDDSGNSGRARGGASEAAANAASSSSAEASLSEPSKVAGLTKASGTKKAGAKASAKSGSRKKPKSAGPAGDPFDIDSFGGS